MIDVQRQLKVDNRNYRLFEILNSGKYERQHFNGVNSGLRKKMRHQQLMVEKGHILIVVQNRNCIIIRIQFAQPWTGWVGYWFVGFYSENERERICAQNAETGKSEEQRADVFVVKNERQSVCTKTDWPLALAGIAHNCQSKRCHTVVRVVATISNNSIMIMKEAV